MKKKESKMEFHDARINDVMLKYMRLSKTLKRKVVLSDYEKIIKMPTRRFWVSEERAYYVIKALIAGKTFPKMCKSRKVMFSDIKERVKALMEEDKSLSLMDACAKAISMPAPQLYLTPLTIKTLISTNRRKWIQERKRKT